MKRPIFIIVFALILLPELAICAKIKIHRRIEFGMDKSIDYAGDLTINYFRFSIWPIIDTVYSAKVINGEYDVEIESGFKYIRCNSFDIDQIHHKYTPPAGFGPYDIWPFYYVGYNIQSDSTKDTFKYHNVYAEDSKNFTMNVQKGYLCNEQGEPCKGFIENHDNKVLANGIFEFRTCSFVPFGQNNSIFIIPNDTNYVPGYWYKDSSTVEWMFKSSVPKVTDSSITIKLKKVKRTGGKYSYTGGIYAGIYQIIGDPPKSTKDGNIQSIPDSLRRNGESPLVYVYDENNDVVAYTYDIISKNYPVMKYTVHGLKPGKYRIKPELRELKTNETWITIKEGDPYNIIDSLHYTTYYRGSNTDPNAEKNPEIFIRQVVVSAKKSRLVIGDTVNVKVAVEIVSGMMLSSRVKTTLKSMEYGTIFSARGAFKCLNFPTDLNGLSTANYYTSTDGKNLVYNFILKVDTIVSTYVNIGAEIIAPIFWNPYDGAGFEVYLSSDSTFLYNPDFVIGVGEEPSSEITTSAFPNPLSPGTPLKISWKQGFEADATAEIYSYAGICINKVPLGFLASGFQTAFIPTDGFLPGAYYVLIRSGCELVKAKFVVK